jgi:histidinol dehydrogenase
MTIPLFDDYRAAEQGILKRIPLDEVTATPAMLDRIERTFGERLTPAQAVDRIIADVRARGDQAVLTWGEKLDGPIHALEVPKEQLAKAAAALEPQLLEALQLAADQLERFHRHQSRTTWVDFNAEGALGQIIRPLERVGLYAPGGAAPLPSSLLHAAIPARVAGVEELIVCSPPQRGTGEVDPVILAAAHVAKIDRVFRVGGAQAIAAMAYGTEQIPQVDKIAGPGSLFVVLAKRAVYGVVGIEALPGPTETLVIADASADPRYAAADLLAQAEHVFASAILITPSRQFAEATQAEVARQLETLSNSEAETVEQRGGIVIVPDLNKAFELANRYAPEHLCLLVEEPWQYVGKIRNAGGIFLGERSFEVLGDYVAGPSHIMPTGGTARYSSPVNVDDFRKIISLVGLNEAALQRIGPAAIRIAQAEGLTAHAAAVQARLANGDLV